MQFSAANQLQSVLLVVRNESEQATFLREKGCQDEPITHTYLRRLSRNKFMALMPSDGIIMAPMPTSSTSGATFVIKLGTSEPSAPTMDAAADMGDWRAWVAVLDEDCGLWWWLPVLPLLLLLLLLVDESVASVRVLIRAIMHSR
jgi:hypothetical protein